MTRPTWTTPEQKEWLDPRKAAFIEAKQKGNAALKEYYLAIFKEFREKWPVPAVTESETTAAGSVELATKAKRDKYDQRVREWFHNNTRNLSSNGSARGLLKIKSKPRVLQGWQAYQALTYESKWKPIVDKEWARYKTEWELEHPKETLPKKRFTFMVEFMKEKYKNETEEMKRQCEEYRQARKSESPVPGDSDTLRNLEFQSAIDKLPRTLATFGQSIMDQTGWHITIMAGGPSPEDGGMIMSFLSHTGKTKTGETYEKFLGTKDYDEKLASFESFLHASFSEEDCATRSLVKGEVQDGDGRVSGPEDEDEKGDKEDGEETGNAPKSAKLCEYLETREKNITDLKKRLAEVEEQFPMPEILKGKVKKVASKKKERSDEPVVRRESPRNKDKSATATSTTGTSDATDSASPDAAEGEANTDITTQRIPPASSALPALPSDDPSPTEASDVPPCDTTTSLPASSMEPHVTQSDAALTLAKADGDVVMQDATPSALELRNNSAAVTQDTTSTSSQLRNDDGLPVWLSQMIGYLRGVSEDIAWQELVTEFVDFERRGPPHGNLPSKLRPIEIANWIKSKKKDIVPSLDVRSYGKIFKEWWAKIQPSWRNEGGTFMRNVPQDESWQTLKKGGTAGIYVVVIGLSWWVTAQRVERDADVWPLVNDLSWVIQQMKRDMGSITPLLQKRTRDADADSEAEGLPKKIRRQSS